MAGREDDERRVKILLILFAVYGQEDKIQRMKIYAEALKPVPLDTLSKACKMLATEKKFLPAISEIIEAVQDLNSEIHGTGVKSWLDAWAEIEKAVWKTGWYAKPTFSTPEIAETVRVFGWHNLMMTAEEALPTVRAQMRYLYEQVCSKKRRKALIDYALNSKTDGLLGIEQNTISEIPARPPELTVEGREAQDKRNLSKINKESLKTRLEALGKHLSLNSR